MFGKISKLTSRAALALMATAVLAGCDSDGTGPDHSEEPVGMVIVDQNNATLVSVDGDQVTGTLTVAAGAARHLEVFFVAEDGDRFQIAEDDDELSLDWTVANENIAVIDSHGDHMDLDGVAAGSTTVVFSIMHGNHSDYDSPLIPITVTP